MRIFQTIKVAMICALVSLSFTSDANALFRMKTLYNITDTPFNFSGDTAPALSVVEEVLKASFEEKGWTVKKVDANRMEASILVRERHYAKVDVTFDTEKYSVMYVDSDMLLYDGKKIHKNYNNWVKAVEKVVGFRVKNINFGTEY